MKMVQVHSVVY